MKAARPTLSATVLGRVVVVVKPKRDRSAEVTRHAQLRNARRPDAIAAGKCSRCLIRDAKPGRRMCLLCTGVSAAANGQRPVRYRKRRGAGPLRAVCVQLQCGTVLAIRRVALAARISRSAVVQLAVDAFLKEIVR